MSLRTCFQSRFNPRLDLASTNGGALVAEERAFGSVRTPTPGRERMCGEQTLPSRPRHAFMRNGSLKGIWLNEVA